jgi:hypothetical protein
MARNYKAEMRRVWGEDITKAERLVQRAESGEQMDNDEYSIHLDPEDFLDLCAGKWHTDKLGGKQ